MKKLVILLFVPVIILQGCLALVAGAVDKSTKKSIILVDPPKNLSVSADGQALTIQSLTISVEGKKTNTFRKLDDTYDTYYYDRIEIEKNKDVQLELKSGTKTFKVPIGAKDGARYSYYLDVDAIVQNKTPRTQQQLKDKIATDSKARQETEKKERKEREEAEKKARKEEKSKSQKK